jgi:carbonic anhydrase/acetyltransferase-like protein (isoleucine patch superfamily)
MENMHVAHDCVLGNNLIIGNSTKFAGEVTIDDNAIISASVLCHQFCRIGGYVMIQGGSRFSQDIPPYIIAGKEPIRYAGINLVDCAVAASATSSSTSPRGYACSISRAHREGTRIKNISRLRRDPYIIDFVSAPTPHLTINSTPTGYVSGLAKYLSSQHSLFLVFTADIPSVVLM